ncbi:MAG: hypothetical protein AAB654_06310, partial [Acidobacteriota bacterium]
MNATPAKRKWGKKFLEQKLAGSAGFGVYFCQASAWHVNAGAGLFHSGKDLPAPSGVRKRGRGFTPQSVGSPPRVLTRGAFQEPRPRLCLPSQGAPNDAGETGARGFVIVPDGR